MLERRLDDMPSTDPCGIFESLPGRLPARTYGMQPTLQPCGNIESHSEAPVYELRHAAPGYCCRCSRRLLAHHVGCCNAALRPLSGVFLSHR